MLLQVLEGLGLALKSGSKGWSPEGYTVKPLPSQGLEVMHAFLIS